ncbi:MAG: hypothetical protein FWC70_05000 [Defluviitaleaceae bacterium]|nr:hypothetical protein [Defluviitaleaceae bacterium]
MKHLQENHDKQNEAYLTAKAKLFEEGGQPGDFAEIANARLDKLAPTDTGGNYLETLDFFVSFFDDVVLECAEITDRREEIETKILSWCAKILPEKSKRDPENEHVTARIIDGDEKMSDAILHDTNPLRLGFFAFLAYCEKNPASPEVLEYLKLERGVRAFLTKGEDAAAFASLEKLLLSPVNCAEKYLLVALCLFYQGFEDDARNSLDVGLKISPNNQRLLSAKDALG